MPNCYRFHEDGLKAMAKYVDLEVLNASVDNRPEANPWNDACLVARKKGTLPNKINPNKKANDKKKADANKKAAASKKPAAKTDSVSKGNDNLESRVNNLESKLDLILDAIEKK